MAFDPNKWKKTGEEPAPVKSLGFDPSKWVSGQESLVPNPGRPNGSSDALGQLLETGFAAPVLGFADTATFGLPSRIPGIKDILERNPNASIPGEIAALFSPMSPAARAFGLAAKGAEFATKGVPRATEGLTKLLSRIPGVPGMVRGGMEKAAPIVGDIAESFANVPLTGAAMEAVQSGGRKILGGEDQDIVDNVLKMADPNNITNIVGVPLRLAGSTARRINLPKAIYRQGAPLAKKDIAREADKGRDIVQEAMDEGLHGTSKQEILDKARAMKDSSVAGRENIINQAEDEFQRSVRPNIAEGIDELPTLAAPRGTAPIAKPGLNPDELINPNVWHRGEDDYMEKFIQGLARGEDLPPPLPAAPAASRAARPANPGYFEQERMRDSIYDSLANLEKQVAKPAEKAPYLDYSERMSAKYPERMSPRAAQDMLLSQKEYLRQRKTDEAISKMFGGQPTTGEFAPRRAAISSGLKEQERQIGALSGADEATKFRGLGKKYGLGSMAERTLIDQMSGKPGLKETFSTPLTTAGVGLKNLLSGTPDYQKILTLIREAQKEGANAGN